MDTFGEYVFKVRSYECGEDGLVTLPSVCNYLQEAASLNAEELGFSKSDFAAAGDDISWVLTRMRVRMDRYPKWKETVRVTTFPRGGRRITARRDFVLTDADGATLGVATTEWMVINLVTRKVVPVPQRVFDLANTVRPPVLGDEPFSKFRYPSAGVGSERLEFPAMNAHIDLNGHVNNVHYIEWMLEPVLGERLRLVSELEIVFRSETFAGDRVFVSVARGSDGEFYHRVFAADGRDHVVAVSRPARQC